MDQATLNIEDHARELAARCVRQGAASEGDPAERVSELYEQLCSALAKVNGEHGSDCMATSAALTAAAIDAGIIYVGGETLSFIEKVGARARAAHRQLSEPSQRF